MTDTIKILTIVALALGIVLMLKKIRRDSPNNVEGAGLLDPVQKFFAGFFPKQPAQLPN